MQPGTRSADAAPSILRHSAVRPAACPLAARTRRCSTPRPTSNRRRRRSRLPGSTTGGDRIVAQETRRAFRIRHREQRCFERLARRSAGATDARETAHLIGKHIGIIVFGTEVRPAIAQEARRLFGTAERRLRLVRDATRRRRPGSPLRPRSQDPGSAGTSPRRRPHQTARREPPPVAASAARPAPRPSGRRVRDHQQHVHAIDTGDRDFGIEHRGEHGGCTTASPSEHAIAPAASTADRHQAPFP